MTNLKGKLSIYVGKSERAFKNFTTNSFHLKTLESSILYLGVSDKIFIDMNSFSEEKVKTSHITKIYSPNEVYITDEPTSKLKGVVMVEHSSDNLKCCCVRLNPQYPKIKNQRKCGDMSKIIPGTMPPHKRSTRLRVETDTMIFEGGRKYNPLTKMFSINERTICRLNESMHFILRYLSAYRRGSSFSAEIVKNIRTIEYKPETLYTSFLRLQKKTNHFQKVAAGTYAVMYNFVGFEQS